MSASSNRTEYLQFMSQAPLLKLHALAQTLSLDTVNYPAWMTDEYGVPQGDAAYNYYRARKGLPAWNRPANPRPDLGGGSIGSYMYRESYYDVPYRYRRVGGTGIMFPAGGQGRWIPGHYEQITHKGGTPWWSELLQIGAVATAMVGGAVLTPIAAATPGIGAVDATTPLTGTIAADTGEAGIASFTGEAIPASTFTLSNEAGLTALSSEGAIEAGAATGTESGLFSNVTGLFKSGLTDLKAGTGAISAIKGAEATTTGKRAFRPATQPASEAASGGLLALLLAGGISLLLLL